VHLEALDRAERKVRQVPEWRKRGEKGEGRKKMRWGIFHRYMCRQLEEKEEGESRGGGRRGHHIILIVVFLDI
jgi:hypothetical protein